MVPILRPYGRRDAEAVLQGRCVERAAIDRERLAVVIIGLVRLEMLTPVTMKLRENMNEVELALAVTPTETGAELY